MPNLGCAVFCLTASWGAQNVLICGAVLRPHGMELNSSSLVTACIPAMRLEHSAVKEILQPSTIPSKYGSYDTYGCPVRWVEHAQGFLAWIARFPQSTTLIWCFLYGGRSTHKALWHSVPHRM
eukprot:1146803-Pelagomonas_calceolata.AAC.3